MAFYVAFWNSWNESIIHSTRIESNNFYRFLLLVIWIQRMPFLLDRSFLLRVECMNFHLFCALCMNACVYHLTWNSRFTLANTAETVKMRQWTLTQIQAPFTRAHKPIDKTRFTQHSIMIWMNNELHYKLYDTIHIYQHLETHYDMISMECQFPSNFLFFFYLCANFHLA